MTTTDTRPRGSRRGGRATRRTTVVALLTAALLVVAGGSAWAYWTATAAGTGTVATHAVTVTTSGFDGLGATYRNHQLAHSGTFTVTNTGQVSGHASISIETLGGGLPALMPVTVWPLTSGPCSDNATPPGGAQTGGTWASFSLLGGVTLAAGQSVTYCVQTVPVSRQSIADGAGSITATPQLTVIFDDDEGWDGTRTETPTTTIKTELIYPFPTVGSPSYVQTGLSDWFTIRRAATTGLCLDVSGSGGNGADVLSYGCHDDPNQRWEIMPATDQGAGTSLVRLRPKHSNAFGTRLAVSGSNQVVVQDYSGSSAAQLWEFQRIASNTFQLVSHSTGLCLDMTTPSSSTRLTVSACDPSSAGRANQQLTLNREPLTFATSGSNVVLGWSTGNTTNNGSPGYQLQQQNGGSGSAVGSASGSAATSLTVAASSLAEGTHQYRVVISGTTNVVYQNITLTMTHTCDWLCQFFGGGTYTVTQGGGFG